MHLNNKCALVGCAQLTDTLYTATLQVAFKNNNFFGKCESICIDIQKMCADIDKKNVKLVHINIDNYRFKKTERYRKEK